jgi:hypothetical protein
MIAVNNKDGPQAKQQIKGRCQKICMNKCDNDIIMMMMSIFSPSPLCVLDVRCARAKNLVTNLHFQNDLIGWYTYVIDLPPMLLFVYFSRTATECKCAWKSE